MQNTTFLCFGILAETEDAAQGRKTLSGKQPKDITGDTDAADQKEYGGDAQQKCPDIDKECCIRFPQSVKDTAKG